jgi:hypothetical protein
MTNMLEEVFQQTGLVGMAVFAGPEPSQGGNISVYEYISSWLSFAQAHPWYEGSTKAERPRGIPSTKHIESTQNMCRNPS